MSDDPVVAERNELLNELIDAVSLPMFDEENEVCAVQIVRKTGKDKSDVTRLLARKVSSGELVSHWAMWEGKRVKAYRKA